MDRIVKIARKVVAQQVTNFNDAIHEVRTIMYGSGFYNYYISSNSSMCKLGYSHNNNILSNVLMCNIELVCKNQEAIVKFIPGSELQKIGIKTKTFKEFDKLKAFIDKLVKKFTLKEQQSKKLDPKKILSDVNSTMRGDEFEDASIQNGALRLSYYGKAYGDGYDFNEKYVNGRFVDGSHGDRQSFSPFFEKQAKYIYEKYKVPQVVIYGSFD